MKLSAESLHDIVVIAISLSLVAVLYGLIKDTSLIAFALFLITLIIMAC